MDLRGVSKTRPSTSHYNHLLYYLSLSVFYETFCNPAGKWTLFFTAGTWMWPLGTGWCWAGGTRWSEWISDCMKLLWESCQPRLPLEQFHSGRNAKENISSKGSLAKILGRAPLHPATVSPSITGALGEVKVNLLTHTNCWFSCDLKEKGARYFWSCWSKQLLLCVCEQLLMKVFSPKL